MKMHEKLACTAKEPRNRVRNKLTVSYHEEAAEPVQLWLSHEGRFQGIFLTRDEAYNLMHDLNTTLESTL